MICSPSPWHSTQSPFWANHSRHRHDHCNDNLMKNFSCWFHHPLSTKRQMLRLFPGGIIDSLHLFYNISALKMQAHTLFLKRNFSTGMLDLICTNKLWCRQKWKRLTWKDEIMSKVIFLDVDGTLCNYEGVIPESAKQAIKQARKNGHKVYICTGRSRAEVYQ